MGRLHSFYFYNIRRYSTIIFCPSNRTEKSYEEPFSLEEIKFPFPQIPFLYDISFHGIKLLRSLNIVKFIPYRTENEDNDSKNFNSIVIFTSIRIKCESSKNKAVKYYNLSLLIEALFSRKLSSHGQKLIESFMTFSNYKLVKKGNPFHIDEIIWKIYEYIGFKYIGYNNASKWKNKLNVHRDQFINFNFCG